MTPTLSRFFIRRLRADGFSVIERARPRVSDMSLSGNHSGVVAAVVAAAGVLLSAVDVGLQPTTFEHWTTRGSGNSRIDNSRTSQIAD